MMKRLLPIVVFAALAAAAAFAQVFLARNRPVKSPAVEEGVFAALGGLRSIVSEIVWFRADRLQEEGRYIELAQLANALALSEPHTPEIWSYAAWNLAYNVSVMMPEPEDRWRWVEAALVLLRDKGLRFNPSSSELHRELAWLFELKIGADLDAAAPLYREKWKTIVDEVARRGAWEELGMEPMLMTEIETRYGVTDRTDAQYSAVYWAHRGLRRAKPEDRETLLAVVRQARILYEKRRLGPRKVPHG
jgi:hypothetical protein